MDAERVDMFLMTSKKYFPTEKIVFLKEKLLAADDSKFNLIQAMDFKDPTTLLIISIFLGPLGVDRFMLGDVGIGVLKLLTAGVCGILTIIDWFTISNKAKEKNFFEIMLAL
ncbi:MAG TPA: hypothetical protein DCY75_08540 [Clostridiales bacterium]|nr:hypothetical protein [Clostridiales bacterium]